MHDGTVRLTGKVGSFFERDAAVDGLRAGMTWVEMRKSNTFTV
ncbi:hypothetical protein [Burkholderia pyrrocinia]|nr:hypothetical protein [Burkholderia pyrrocinia]